jgi:hypothetical protein
MSSSRIQQGATRVLASQSLTLGSSAGGSTTPFGSQTVLVRAVSTQPAVVLITNSPSVSSTTINATGFYLPGNTAEYFQVTPGMSLSGVTTSTSATLYLSECGA